MRAGDHKRPVVASLLALVAILGVAVPAWATGELSQARGRAGCITMGKKLAKVCAKGHAFKEPSWVVASPDGKNVYVVGYESDAVAILNRDPATGALTQKAGKAGCVSDRGVHGCGRARALEGPRAVAISADGRNVYVVSDDSRSVTIFDRDPATGALIQKAGQAGCVSSLAAEASCARSSSLQQMSSVYVSPDGKSVYALASAILKAGGKGFNPGTVTVLDREPSTGVLTQPAGPTGCYSEGGTHGLCARNRALSTPFIAVVSPDSKNIYVNNARTDKLAVLSRDPVSGELSLVQTTQACQAVSSGKCIFPFGAASGLAVSPDGKNVYVTGIGGRLGIFDRDPATGKLTQKPGSEGCFAEGHPRGACRASASLHEALAVVVSPDGRSVYVSAYDGSGIAIFDRDPATGSLTKKAGRSGCFLGGKSKHCRTGRAFSGALGMTISPDGKDLYLSSTAQSSVATFRRAG